MQKYKRLILVIIALLSLVLMFIYRQKYSNLSLVFQMMNAFQFRDSETKYNEKLFEFKKNLKIDFSVQEQIVGIPYWTEIFPNIYVYSSYWMYKKSRSLIFTKNTSVSMLWKMECKLHYEKENQKFLPKTNLILLDKQDTNMFLFLECMPFEGEVPHSISFVYRNLTSLVSLPVIHKESYIGHFTMCVQPLPSTFKDVNRILEFIIYHSQMGIKFFIFYEAGLSFNVRKLLKHVAVKDNINLLILPWNLPFYSQNEFSVTELYFLDCFHRVLARNHSDFALKLELNDFIVPKNAWNFTYFNAHDSSVNVYRLYRKVFCEEYPNDIIAHSLFMPFVSLLKTKVSNENGSAKEIAFDVKKLKQTVSDSKEFHSWFQLKKLQKTRLIPDTSVVLHSYNKCGLKSDNDKESFSEDRSMWKYKDTFFKSHLYLLAKTEDLIDS
ncbi:uncharacterized protein LOC129958524 [Argiope bruennichi]|uniref:uncharacterized protein LOC129958524 n=1 Tax=Argiope bruennichi TaxID=94029 RepID=UPI00249408B6|nr:uncharacterized protein LOC129958524 [Argiope bruennichi]XP_055927030.1 uncharacterized protein LOC129958524 [Argiope bruennichi]XP_055927032.1 uncharacterized protein LOC129958524 [Argiope bruennichi]